MEWGNKMRKGLTLIEMLVAVTITSIILAVAVKQFTVQQRHIDMQEKQIKLDRDTRLTLTFIANELREVGLDPKKTHSFGIINGDSHSIAYTADLDLDGVLDANETFLISRVGDYIVFNNTDSIIQDAITLDFTYFNERDDTITVPISEDDGFGYFYDTVATFEVHLTTEMQRKNRTVARSNQTIEVERKNR